MFAIGTLRALTSEPLLLHAAVVDGKERSLLGQRSLGVTLLLSSAFASVILISALLCDSTLRSVLFVLAATLPGLAVQDAARFVLFASGRHRAAAFNDLAWAVAAIGSFVIFRQFWPDVGAARLFLLWSVAVSIAGVAAVWQAGCVPKVRAGVLWMRHTGRLGMALAWDFILFAGASQIAIGLIAPIAGLEGMAAFRGAGTLLGPLNVLLAGARIVTLPELSRLESESSQRARRAAVRLSAALVLMCGCAGTAILLLPDGLGESLLGRSWLDARPVVLPMTIMLMARAGTEGAWSGLRVLRAGGALTRVRITVVPIIVGAGLVGATTAGAVGAATGMAGANLLALVLFWRGYVRESNRELFPYRNAAL